MEALFPATASAVFSPCRRWRFVLRRKLTEAGPKLVVIGLNPSTADETTNDPTIRRCIGFAEREGCAELVMLNLFGWRSTDPAGLDLADDPVGEGHDDHVRAELAGDVKVVAAWGSHGDRFSVRVRRVLELLAGHQVWCLGTTKSGQPRHPLYIRGDQPLVPWGPLRWLSNTVIVGEDVADHVSRTHPDWAFLGIRGVSRPALGAATRGPRLTLHFDDIGHWSPHWDPPAREHAAAIVAFGRCVVDESPPGLVVHCAAGISRSSAALIGVLAAAGVPDLTSALDGAVALARERGWRDETPIRPNPRLVALLDAELGRGGRLVQQVWPWLAHCVRGRTLREVMTDADAPVEVSRG